MLNSVNPIVLRLKKGNIPVEINCYEKINENRFTMKQSQPDFGAIYSAEKISKALNISMEMLDISMPIQEINTGLPYLIIFWKDLKSIEKITLNANNVEQFLKNEKLFKSNNPRGLTTSIFFITKETTEIQNNYHTRMFVLEGSSIWEDAATGSANGCLLAYLLKYNNPIQSVIVEQGYEMKRKSILYLEESLKKNEYSLKVGGRIVPICEGTWAI